MFLLKYWKFFVLTYSARCFGMICGIYFERSDRNSCCSRRKIFTCLLDKIFLWFDEKQRCLLSRGYEELRAKLAKRILIKIFKVHLIKPCYKMINPHVLRDSPLLSQPLKKHKVYKSDILLWDNYWTTATRWTGRAGRLCKLFNMQGGLYCFPLCQLIYLHTACTDKACLRPAQPHCCYGNAVIFHVARRWQKKAILKDLEIHGIPTTGI